MGLPPTNVGSLLGDVVGATVGIEDGAGVLVPAKYVGANVGSTLGDCDGHTDGFKVGLPKT